MDTLKALLNEVSICDQPSRLFDQIAHNLLNNIALMINGYQFRLLEIEFYIYNHHHTDIFAHCFKYQKTHFKWYFHHASEKEHSYKGGNYKGLDLTCGNENTYGGILIRAIQNDKGEIIEGPCRVVNKILELTGCESILELVTSKLQNNIEADNPFLCLKASNFPEEFIFRSPRIGLTLKKSDNLALREQYISKLYRFLIYPQMISKGKKMITMIAINDNDKTIIAKYFGFNETAIEKLKSSIPKLENYDINQYKGKDLTDNQRLELYFSSKCPKQKIELKNRIKINLKPIHPM